VPHGLAGYNIYLAVENPQTAEIIQVTTPGDPNLLTTISTMPSDRVWVKKLYRIEPGATNIELFTFTVQGDAPGTTHITLNPIRIDDIFGNTIPLTIVPAVLTIEEVPAPAASVTPEPTSSNSTTIPAPAVVTTANDSTVTSQPTGLVTPAGSTIPLAPAVSDTPEGSTIGPAQSVRGTSTGSADAVLEQQSMQIEEQNKILETQQQLIDEQNKKIEEQRNLLDQLMDMIRMLTGGA
jgi:hypothetical protein